jgi:hypothetical protein
MYGMTGLATDGYWHALASWPALHSGGAAKFELFNFRSKSMKPESNECFRPRFRPLMFLQIH